MFLVDPEIYYKPVVYYKFFITKTKHVQRS